MDSKYFPLLIIGILAVILVLAVNCAPTKSKFGFQQHTGENAPTVPNKSRGYYQFMGPSQPLENAYHQCMVDDCNADYFNYKCRQKCYVKTMKNGTIDRADYLCWQHKNNEDDYYECLDGVYGNYKWADRGIRPDGQCLCPPPTPLNDRYPRDNEWKPVTI